MRKKLHMDDSDIEYFEDQQTPPQSTDNYEPEEAAELVSKAKAKPPAKRPSKKELQNESEKKTKIAQARLAN